MSLRENIKYYYDEVQKLLEKYGTGNGQVDWWPVCRDLFNKENPVILERDLKDESADYSGQKAENSAWTFSLYITAWSRISIPEMTRQISNSPI